MSQSGSGFPQFWQFLRPGLNELVLYTAALLILLGVALYQLAISGSSGVDAADVVNSFHAVFNNTSSYVNDGTGWASFFLFGFWFIIGGVVYTIIWATATIVVDVRNDLRVSETFVHPRSFHKSDFWVSIIARTAVRAVAGIALLFYSVFWLWVVAPIGVSGSKQFLQEPGSLVGFSALLIVIVGVVVTLHIGTVLVRLVFLRPNNTLDTAITHH